MCEFLIKATEHWMDDVKQGDRNKYWTTQDWEQFERRTQLGDPIVVMPDGHGWGAEEGLPKFIVARVLDMDVTEGQSYLDQLFTEIEHLLDNGEIEIEQIRIRNKKNAVPKNWVSTVVTVHDGFIEITRQQFLDQVITKIL